MLQSEHITLNITELTTKEIIGLTSLLCAVLNIIRSVVELPLGLVPVAIAAKGQVSSEDNFPHNFCTYMHPRWSTYMHSKWSTRDSASIALSSTLTCKYFSGQLHSLMMDYPEEQSILALPQPII